MTTELLLYKFLDKFHINNSKTEEIETVTDNPNIKCVKINEEKKKEISGVSEISKIGGDNTEVEKPYALKSFGATLSSYHYKKNSRKPLVDEAQKKKQKEVVVIEKLGDLVNIEKKD